MKIPQKSTCQTLVTWEAVEPVGKGIWQEVPKPQEVLLPSEGTMGLQPSNTES